MHLDARRLAVLLAVHRCGGILAAAGELCLSPSAVSQQIARLEAETGLRVLDRHPSGAVLTPAGRVLVAAAERIEAELTDARKKLAPMRGEAAGSVVIGAFPTIITGLLAGLVGQLRHDAPGLELRLRQIEAEPAQRELRRGTIDVLLTEADGLIGQTTPEGTRDVIVMDEPWLVALPAHYPAPRTLADLETYPWLGAEPHTAAHRVIEQAQSRLHAKLPTVHRYDDYTVAFALVAEGAGIAVLPALAAASTPPAGVQIASVPGLGTRQIIARHRTTGADPTPQTRAILDRIVMAAVGQGRGPGRPRA